MNSYKIVLFTFLLFSSFTFNLSALPAQVTLETTCDLIILQNGDELEVKNLEIGSKEISYTLCEDLKGDVITQIITDVSLIKYSNGVEISIHSSTDQVTNEEGQKTNKSQTAGKVTAGVLMGLIVGGLLVAVIIFAAILNFFNSF